MCLFQQVLLLITVLLNVKIVVLSIVESSFSIVQANRLCILVQITVVSMKWGVVCNFIILVLTRSMST